MGGGGGVMVRDTSGSVVHISTKLQGEHLFSILFWLPPILNNEWSLMANVYLPHIAN